MSFFGAIISTSSSLLLLLLLLLLLGSFCTPPLVSGQSDPFAVTELDAVTFKQYIDDSNKFDVIVDVRTFAEWQTGHIEGATLVENLASFGSGASTEIGTPADLAGCEYCNIAVYCRSGSRARQALNNLIAAGFKGRLYNGLGVSQWEGEDYPLVDTPSVIPPCTVDPDVSEQCRLAYLAYTGGGDGDGVGSGAVCQSAATCGDCLNSGCAWAAIEQCLGSCREIADVGCYSSEFFQGTSEEICAEAAADKSDSELCRGISSNCAVCTSTVKSDGVSTCEWYDDGTDAWCGIGGCNQISCGSTECKSAPVPASPPVKFWGPTTWSSSNAPPVASTPVASPVFPPVRIWGPTTWNANTASAPVRAPASIPINYSWVSSSWDSSAKPPVGTSGGGGGGPDNTTPLSDPTAATEDKSGTCSYYSNFFVLVATAGVLLAWMNIFMM